MSTHEGQKTVTINVNTVDHTVSHERISYNAIVELAFPGTSGGGALYIVKYSRGSSDNETGTLRPGDSAMVKDGMRFRVSPTGES